MTTLPTIIPTFSKVYETTDLLQEYLPPFLVDKNASCTQCCDCTKKVLHRYDESKEAYYSTYLCRECYEKIETRREMPTLNCANAVLLGNYYAKCKAKPFPFCVDKNVLCKFCRDLNKNAVREYDANNNRYPPGRFCYECNKKQNGDICIRGKNFDYCDKNC